MIVGAVRARAKWSRCSYRIRGKCGGQWSRGMDAGLRVDGRGGRRVDVVVGFAYRQIRLGCRFGHVGCSDRRGSTIGLRERRLSVCAWDRGKESLDHFQFRRRCFNNFRELLLKTTWASAFTFIDHGGAGEPVGMVVVWLV